MTFMLIRKRKKRKKSKKAAFDDSGNVTEHKIKRIHREVETKVREAEINCSTLCPIYLFSSNGPFFVAVFSQFNFADAAAEHPKMPTPPEEDTVWNDNICRSCKSGDGEKLVYFLLHCNPQGSVVCLFGGIQIS